MLVVADAVEGVPARRRPARVRHRGPRAADRARARAHAVRAVVLHAGGRARRAAQPGRPARTPCPKVIAERERLADALDRIDGVEVYPSGANFLMFRWARRRRARSTRSRSGGSSSATSATCRAARTACASRPGHRTRTTSSSTSSGRSAVGNALRVAGVPLLLEALVAELRASPARSRAGRVAAGGRRRPLRVARAPHRSDARRRRWSPRRPRVSPMRSSDFATPAEQPISRRSASPSMWRARASSRSPSFPATARGRAANSGAAVVVPRRVDLRDSRHAVAGRDGDHPRRARAPRARSKDVRTTVLIVVVGEEPLCFDRVPTRSGQVAGAMEDEPRLSSIRRAQPSELAHDRALSSSAAIAPDVSSAFVHHREIVQAAREDDPVTGRSRQLDALYEERRAAERSPSA